MSDLNLSYTREFQNQIFMATLCIKKTIGINIFQRILL